MKKGLINLANQYLKTPVSTDAELNQALASGSGEEFANLITGLVPAINIKITESLLTQPTFTKMFLQPASAMGELVRIKENNFGDIVEYDIDKKVESTNKTGAVLVYEYRTAYKKKTWTTISQENFKEAFINGANFSSWLNQKIQREIVMPVVRWLEGGMQGAILREFKNVIPLTVSKDWDPTLMPNIQEGMVKIVQELTKGMVPSCLYELGYSQTDLATANGKYNAKADIYQASFDKTKHLINAFVSSDLYMGVSPKIKEAIEQAMANLYHDEKIALSGRFKQIVAGNQILDDEIYFWAPDTIAVEQTLKVSKSQEFASSLTTDIFSHNWFRLKAKPWGIGFKFKISKTK